MSLSNNSRINVKLVPAVKKGAFHEMSRIMWTSASLSMTEAQLAVYPAGSQVMRRGDKAQHSAHKRHWPLGKCVKAFKESHKDLVTLI